MDINQYLASAGLSPDGKPIQSNEGVHPVDAVWPALIQQESGGRQFGADGQPLRSKVGATGRAQVMRATGPEAAALAGLPWDERRWEQDPEYNEAIGKAYLGHLYGRFGSIDKALAAYNGGMGNLGQAMRTAQANSKPDDWLSYMPEETRNYVPKILGGKIAQPSQQRNQQPSRAATSQSYEVDEPVKPDTITDSLKNTGIALLQGLNTGGQMVADAAGAGSDVSEWFRGNSKALQDQLSDERKAEIQRDQEAIKDAEVYGSAFDEVVANLKSYANAPLDTTLQAVGTMAPTILTMAIPGANATMATRLIAMGASGLVQGLGVGKGSIYDGVQQGLIDAGVDKDTAKKVAIGAQAYDGENGGEIALNGLLGIAASLTGADKFAAKALAGKMRQEAVQLAAQKGKMSAFKATIGGAAEEAVPEAAQAGYERYTQNKAVAGVGQDMGITDMANTPPMQGVAGQSAMDAVAAGPLGGIGGFLDRPTIDPIQHVRDKAKEPNSPLSNAVDKATPKADPLTDRINALKTATPDILTGLRNSSNPSTAQDFVDTLNQAGNPNMPRAMREAMVAQMEQYAAHAQAGVVPGMQLSGETGLQEQTTDGIPPDGGTPPGDGPTGGIGGPQGLPDPNVIDVNDVTVTEEIEPAGQVAPGGEAAPAGNPIQDTPSPAFTEVAAPPVSIPSGSDTAFNRKRKAQLDALASQGFETVAQEGGEFRMVNSKTSQFFPLTSPAEIALARKAITDKINSAANKAATSPENDLREPTEAQKKAGNYKKGEPFNLNGFSVTVENPAGSVRKGVDPDGKAWESPIVHHYGDLNGVTGLDGDKMDVFVGPSPWNQSVFVVDQVNPKTGKLDEHKVMMGFGSVQDAAQGYLANYEKGWKGLGNITEMSLSDFRQWTKSSGIKRAAADSKRGKVYAGASFGVTNDTGTNQAGNRGADQGVGAYGAEGARDQGADASYSQGRRPYPDEGVAGGVGVGQSEADARAVQLLGQLNQSERERGRDSVSELASGPVADATNAFLDALAKVTGRRGFAIKNTGRDAFDGVEFNGEFFVNTDKPVTPIPFTIAHEFKHMAEDYPGLEKLHNRMWDMIPDSVKREYSQRVQFPKKSYDSLTKSEIETLKAEITADFMGTRFMDGAWLRRLGREKPNLFAEFVRDWLSLLNRMITEIRQMLGSGNRNKNIDYLMRDYLKELEAMKSIAIEVAAEWAKQNPGLAKKSGLNYSTRVQNGIQEQDGILSKNRIDGTTGRLDRNSGTANGAARDGRPNVLGDAGAQRLDVLQPPALRDTGERGARNGVTGTQAGRAAGYGRPDAETQLGGRNQPKAPDRRGFYGTPQEGSVEVTGYHFSKLPRETLISDFYGTGLKGAERERLLGPENADIRPRIFFYVNRGNQIKPESGVGAVMHKLTMRNLYDVTADDLGIVASTRGKGIPESERPSAWERAVMNAGFDGYVVKNPIQPQWYAVLVGKHAVQPSLDPAQVAEAAERSKPKQTTRKEGNELVSKPGNDQVVPLLTLKPKILEGAPSFKFQWGEVRVLESEADVANAVIEDAGINFKFNTRESLPTGNPKEVTDNLLSDNYQKLEGVQIEVETPNNTNEVMDAKQALEQIDKRRAALEMVMECLI